MQDHYITGRDVVAQRELTQLTAVTDEIQKTKTSSDAVQAIGTQISVLRGRQPASYLLLMSLNRQWPTGRDSWQINEITSNQDGTVQIKGRTTSDAQITEFAKNLDFSEDFDQVKVSKAGGGATASGITSQGQSGGIIEFAVEALYKPISNSSADGTGNGIRPPLPASVPIADPTTSGNKPQIAEKSATLPSQKLGG